MKTVRLKNNIVVETIPEYALPVEKWYGKEFASQCMEAPDNVEQGWIYDEQTGEFFPDDPDIESIKSSKLKELSQVCNQTITAGCDVILSDSTTGHISMTDEDQINLMSALAAVQKGETGYPYHLDGDLCRMYSAADITIMVTAATQHKLYHTTYCNHLNVWVKRCETVEEVEAITYGITLPDDLATNMAEVLNHVG